MKNLEKFEELVDILQENQHDLKTIEQTANAYNKVVYELAEKELPPTSKEGERFLKKSNILTKLGRKILNLLVIEFKVSFAGVVLCHARIPKLDDIDEVNKINS